jgi:hypothetical protein
MEVAMITLRMAELAALRAGLEQRSARVEGFHDGWSFLQAVRTRRWDLVLMDGVSLPFRAFTEDLLAVNASLTTAVITAVATGVPATIRGEWLRGSGPIHLLHATLKQDGKVRASARAKFFEGNPAQPSQPLPGGSDVRQLLKHARKRLI